MNFHTQCIFRRLRAVAFVALAGLLPAACIDSKAPILTDAKPLFGKQARFHFYGLRDGAAHDEKTATYNWNGSRYAVSGKRNDMEDFTIHEFEGSDFIVQGISPKKGRSVEYALARKLADGVYLVIVIDESDADEATRTKFCLKAESGPCSVETQEQLFGLARATAAKPRQQGGLAVLVAGTGRPRE